MKKILLIKIAFASLLSLLFISCQKDINVTIPEVESQIVIDGYIESDGLPIVVITQTLPYFNEFGPSELYSNFIHDAIVSVKVDGTEHFLQEICSSEIPDSLLAIFMELSGIYIAPGSELNICLYTDLSFSLIGEAGKSYQLKVETNGEMLSSITKIPEIVTLDSVWFQVEGNLDSLGLAWAILSDPDTLGNAYRWSARRISHYPDGSIKDPVYISPFNSATDDQFFNGLSFEFNSFRGSLPYSEKEDDNNIEAGYFKIGDSIAVKGMSIDIATYKFLRSYYTELANQGSPFASPASLQTNIEGGLGIWAGYGIHYDTIYALP